MMRLIITGSQGRMGRTLVACAAHQHDLQVVGQIDQGDEISSVIEKGDVVIDFSSHNATPAIARLCSEHKKAMVIGTTGHSDEDRSQITAFSSRIPMVFPRTSPRGSTPCFGSPEKRRKSWGPALTWKLSKCITGSSATLQAAPQEHSQRFWLTFGNNNSIGSCVMDDQASWGNARGRRSGCIQCAEAMSSEITR